MIDVMAALIDRPWLAAVLAVLCAALWRWRGQRIAAITAVAWALYGAYEYLMYFRVLCTGECNIRVDLLAIYPVLALLTLAALLASVRRGHDRAPAAPRVQRTRR